jgi:hypothetical protein
MKCDPSKLIKVRQGILFEKLRVLDIFLSVLFAANWGVKRFREIVVLSFKKGYTEKLLKKVAVASVGCAMKPKHIF